MNNSYLTSKDLTINVEDAAMFALVSGLCCLSAILVHQIQTRKVNRMPFMNIWNEKYQSYQPLDMSCMYLIGSPCIAEQIHKNNTFYFSAPVCLYMCAALVDLQIKSSKQLECSIAPCKAHSSPVATKSQSEAELKHEGFGAFSHIQSISSRGASINMC